MIEEPEQLRTYECDGLTGHKVVPSLVVLPETTEEVQAVVARAPRRGVPFVARGAGHRALRAARCRSPTAS